MLTTRNLPYIPASITYNRPIGQARYGQSAPACLRKGFAIIQQARHSYQSNQVHFRLGLQVHFQLLPTPPCGDAVTFSCAPGLVRKRPDFHGLISCFRNRTVLRLQRIFSPPFVPIRVNSWLILPGPEHSVPSVVPLYGRLGDPSLPPVQLPRTAQFQQFHPPFLIHTLRKIGRAVHVFMGEAHLIFRKICVLCVKKTYPGHEFCVFSLFRG